MIVILCQLFPCLPAPFPPLPRPAPPINVYITFWLNTALECSACLNQLSHLSLKIRSSSTNSSFISISFDLTVTTSLGMILKIRVIMVELCVASAKASAWSTAKFHWHKGWCSTCKSCTPGHRTCERGSWTLELAVVP